MNKKIVFGVTILYCFLVLSLNQACSSENENNVKNPVAPLFRAIINGETGTIETMIKSGANVNARDEKGNTPLMAAAEFGSSSAVELLISGKANINEVNGLGKTALILTANYRNVMNAAALIKAGADINVKDKFFKMNAFLYAIKFDCVEIAKILMDKGADVHAVDCDGNDALAVAVRHNNPAAVKFLLENKFDPNGLMIPKEGETHLMYAAGKGMADVVKILIEKGADVEKTSVCGFTALTYASVSKVGSVVDIIIEKAKAGNKDNETTAMIYAIIADNEYMVSKLIKRGCDPNIKYRPIDGNKFYESDMPGRLFEQIVNNGIIAEREMTPLVAACASGRTNIVKTLVSGGAKVDLVSKGCHTPLMISLNYEQFDIAKYLIEKGADVNAKNARGETPLMIAAFLGNTEIVKSLIERGADIECVDSKGKSAPYIAFCSGNEELLDIFVKKGVDMSKVVNSNPDRFSNPLEQAIESENIPLLKSLIKMGVRLNAKSEFNHTPLSAAARSGNYEIAKLLIDTGADVNLVTGSDSNYAPATALDSALEAGNDEIIKLLFERGHKFDKDKFEKYGKNQYHNYTKLLCELGFREPRYYSTKPWNIKGFPERLRKTINGAYYTGDRRNKSEIIMDTLPPVPKEDVDVRDKSGNTALLYLAREQSQEQTLKLLIENHADVNAQNNDGETPLSIAIYTGNTAYYDFFINSGAKIDFDEEKILENIIKYSGARNESIKILLDMAKRKKYSLKCNEKMTYNILSKCQSEAVESFYKDKLLGIEKADSQTVELCFKNKDGFTSNVIKNGFLLSKLINLSPAETILTFEKSRTGKIDSLEVMFCALSVKNYPCLEYFIGRQKPLDKNHAASLLSRMLERSRGTIESEIIKISLDILDSTEIKLPEENRKRFLYTILPEMIKLKQNDAVKSFLNKNDLSADGYLNRLMIRAASTSANTEMNGFLMRYLPVGDKLFLTAELLSSNEEKRINNEPGPENKDVDQLIALIKSGGISEFKKKYDPIKFGNKEKWKIRNVYSAALSNHNNEAAKYLIDKETDFFDKRYVEDAISSGNFTIADYAISKGARLEDPAFLYFEAVRDDNLELINYLLKIGANPNLKHIDEKPLAYCLKNKRLEIFEKLVEGGADLVAGRPDGGSGNYFGLSGKFDCFGMQSGGRAEDKSTLLNYAITNNLFDSAMILAPKEPDINISGALGKCALELAVERNYTDVALELLKRKDIDLKSRGVKNALSKAINTGNVKIIRKLIECGVSVCDDFKPETIKSLLKNNREYITALISAMVKEKKSTDEVFISLNSAGASTDEILIGAIKAGDNEMVKLCIANGANVNVSGSNARTPLELAIESGDALIVETLIKKGAKPNATDAFKRPLVFVAALANRLDIIKILIENGANVNARDSFSMNGLYAALDVKNAEMVKYLIERKAEPSNAIIKCVTCGETEMLKMLLENGASANACDQKGKNALVIAREKLQYEAVEALLKHGADINFAENINASEKIFQIIAENGNINYAVELVKKVKNLEDLNCNGDTLLTAALKKFDMKALVGELVESGADMNACDSSKTTVLMLFLDRGGIEVDEEFVLSNFKNYNAKNIYGKNALFFCARRDMVIVRALVDAGCDINAQDSSGTTPLMDFIAKEAFESVKFLLALGADVDYQNNQGETALMMAIKKINNFRDQEAEWYTAIIKKIAGSSKNIDIRDNAGNTALFYAARVRRPEIVKLLIELGADVSVKNNADEGALLEANDRESIDIEKENNEIKAELSSNAKINNNKKIAEYFFRAARRRDKRTALLCLRSLEATDGLLQQKIIDSLFYMSDTEGVRILAERMKTPEDRKKFMNDCFQRLVDFKKSAAAVSLAENNPEIDIKRKCPDSFPFIVNAARDESFSLMKYILAKGESINQKVWRGDTALYYACLDGNIPMIKFLEENGADFNVKTDDGSSVMMAAANAGQIEVIKYLKSKGMDINQKNRFGLTPLIEAVIYGRMSVVKYLLENGADVDAYYSGEGSPRGTALSLAIEKKKPGIVRILLDKTKNIKDVDFSGNTALHLAAEKGNVEYIKYFVEKGLDINSKNIWKSTPLIVALAEKKYAAAKCLLKLGANVNIGSDRKKTAVRIAFENNYDELAFEMCGLTDDKNQVLAEAIRFGKKDLAEKLLDSGLDFNAIVEGAPLVVIAAENNKMELFKLLVDRGADINLKDKKGSAAILAAAQGGNIEMLKYLRGKGQDINSRNRFGTTPLIAAASTNNAEMIKYLIACGADVNGYSVEPHNFGSALKFAAKHTNKQIVELLIQNKACLSGIPGVDALNSAIYYKSNEIVRLLIETGADVNGYSWDNESPLYCAVISSNPDMAAVLIINGASFDPQTEKGKKMIDTANGQFDRKNARLLSVAPRMPKIKADLVKTVNDISVFISGKSILAKPIDKIGRASELIKHINKADKPKVADLLASGYEINLKNVSSLTPLISAIETGSVEIAKLLIDKGADVNFKGALDETPLIYAIKKQNVEIAKMLVDKGADVNFVNLYNIGPIFQSITSGNEVIFEYLISKGAELNIATCDKTTPLMLAVKNDKIKIMELLLSKGADVNFKNIDGISALTTACEEWHYDAAKILLKNGAALPDDKDLRDHVKFYFSIESGSTAEVNALIKSGSDVNCHGVNKYTPLLMALKKGQHEIALALIENGADLKAAASEKESARILAGKSGNEKIYAAFAKRGCDLSAEAAKYYIEEFTKASKMFNDAKALAALSKIPDVNMKLENGIPFVMHAATNYSSQKVMNAICSRGADMSLRNSYGETVLKGIVSNCQLDDDFFTNAKNIKQAIELNPKIFFNYRNDNSKHIKKFAELGAKVDYMDNTWETLLINSLFSESFDNALEFIKLGADVKFRNDKGMNALMYNCGVRSRWPEVEKRSEICRQIVLRGIDINESDKTGNTALHHAVNSRNVWAAKLLLESGAKSNLQNLSGETPLYILSTKYHDTVADVKALIKSGALFFNQNSAAISIENIKSLAKIKDLAAAKLIAAELVNGNCEINEEMIEKFEAEGAKKELMLLSIVAMKKKMEPQKIWKWFFSKVKSDDAEVASLILENGDREFIEFSKKLGMKFNLQANFEKELKNAIKSRNMEVVTFLVKDNQGLDIRKNREIFEIAKAERNPEAVKIILSKMGTFEIGFAVILSDIFIENIDTDGIHLLSGHIENNNKAIFYDRVISDIFLKKTNLQFYVDIFNQRLKIGNKSFEVYAAKSISGALYNNRDDIAFYFEGLLKSGKSKYNSHLLNCAAFFGRTEIMKKLLDEGADPDSKDELGNTVLLRAVLSGRIETVKLIIDRGANLKSASGTSAIFLAMNCGFHEILSLLIFSGADLNVKSSQGFYPLHYAVSQNNLQLIKLLIDKGANPDLKDDFGKTAFDYARANGSDKIIKMIEGIKQKGK